MTNQEIWKAALGELELTVSKAMFSTWFKDTFILTSENGNVTVGVPNGFAKEWLEGKMKKEVFRALQHVTNNGVREIKYQITSKAQPQNPQQQVQLRQPVVSMTQQSVSSAGAAAAAIASAVATRPSQPTVHITIPATASHAQSGNGGMHTQSASAAQSGGTQTQSHTQANDYFSTNLNPKYRFESFVVGSNNELARAACLAVANNIGHSYNPLFIYGGVGLGKTHLLQAVGNAILEKDPTKKVRYVSSEHFTNEVVEAIRKQTMSQVKEKYRQVDLLIIDDIQFLATKEKTQEEFFHTFNTLYEANKQIIISSDRPPKAIPTLEARLQSRFEGGMIADIGAPDLETRIAILQKKAIEKNFPVQEGVLSYIASHIQNNVRELEGAMNRVIAQCQIEHLEPTLENAKSVLNNITSAPSKKATSVERIIDATAGYYHCNKEDLVGKSRKKEIVRPRQVAMYLLREEFKASFPQIGQELGGKDHTTAMHAYQKVKSAVDNEDAIRQDIDLIRQRLYSE